jgi:predicted alpha/beta superfamily hydrolase
LVASFFGKEDIMEAVSAWAQAARVPVPFSRRFTLPSRHVGDEFVIDIALPAPYLPGAAPWPVLFVTDGNLAFTTAAATMGILPLEPGGPRPACVVGIGYALAGEGEHGEHFARRNRDLTPHRVEEWEARMRGAPPPFRFGDDLQTGGSECFLDFIIDELKPWLAANLPVDTDDCTLAGSSFGATLALHALFTRPGAFRAHLAISPSLWWANGQLVAMEEEFARSHADLDAALYLCVGSAEEAQAPEARMVSAFRKFASKLEARAYPSLRLTHEVLPGETHVSVFNAGLTNGIRRLFGATWLTG